MRFAQIIPIVLVSVLAACAGRPAVEASSVTGAMSLARSEMAEGRFASARETLLEIRHRVSDTDLEAEHAWLLGRSTLEAGDPRAALEPFRRCRKLVGQRGDLGYRSSLGLGEAYLEIGDWPRAERALQEAVNLGRDARQQDVALVRLAEGALEHDDPGKSRAYFERVQDRSQFRTADLAKKLEGVTASVVPSEEIVFPEDVTPDVLPRSDWDEEPELVVTRRTMSTPRLVTIHHDARPGRAPTTRGGAVERLRDLQDEAFDLGRDDIPFHYVIDGAGRIWEACEVRWHGAHTGVPSLDEGNIGVCLMGTFHRRDPSAAQRASLRRLLLFLCEHHRISAGSVHGLRTMLRRHPEATSQSPGARVEALLVRLRRRLPTF